MHAAKPLAGGSAGYAMTGVALYRPPERRIRLGPPSTATWSRPDRRRSLQLVLGAVWLLDGLLQLQGFFFTKQFGAQMIKPMAPGNPGIIAHPVIWSGSHIAQNAVVANTVFASIQIALSLGIAWRPSRKAALAGSVAWSLAVWWIGEALGGVLNGRADTVNGAPGAVIIYALLAVLLWPRETPATGCFVAAGAVGERTAKVLWLVLWGSLAYFALAGAHRGAQGLHDLISSQEGGEPGWLASLDRSAASLVAHDGLAWSVALAALLCAVAVGVFLPRRLPNATIALGIVLAAVIWVVGENFGDLFTNGATDPNTGPLLVLLCAAYWVTARELSIPQGRLA